MIDGSVDRRQPLRRVLLIGRLAGDHGFVALPDGVSARVAGNNPMIDFGVGSGGSRSSAATRPARQ
jgi:hypothetical protein